jgi:prepilin-type N-terminal cleavage/methylation domain-containing protein
MRENRQGFTLIEIAISVFIMLLVMLIAVPSLSGVLANRRLQRSLDEFNNFVRMAQERSVEDHRPYLISWADKEIILRPESITKDEDPGPTSVFKLQRGDAFVLELPAALVENPPADWVFWPSGICEPATVTYKGPAGTWRASYSSLTARGQLLNYAAK